MPLAKRRSERSLGSSFSSLSWSCLFGLDDEIDDESSLSNFQQQSLSVFESDHLWAHFKAHLAENNIHTAAGVKAMLPMFVNDRVMDGSVQSERDASLGTRSISTVGSSVEESSGTRNNRYPAAMRRQESFGRNAVKYGSKLSRTSSAGSSRSINTAENDMDTYYEAIRGDTRFLCNDANTEKDVNLLTSVSRRLSKMTSESVASKRFSSASIAASPSRDRHSLTNEFKDPPSSYTSETSNAQASPTPMDESSGYARSRPKFRRPSTYTDDDDDVSTHEHQLLADFVDKTRRPSESSIQSELSREIAELAENVLLDTAGQHESPDVSSLVGTLYPKSFSYQPQRRRKEDHLQESDDPAFNKDSKNERNDSNSHKNDVVHKDDRKEVPSYATSDTLLVEWGECDSTSTDEDCCEDGTRFDDSDRAVINRGNLVCNSHEEEEEDSTIAAGSEEVPKSRRGMLVEVFSTFSLGKGNR